MFNTMIITAEQRMKEGGNTKGIIFGAHGIGKTALAKTLDPKTTLFINMEAGTKSLGDWAGDIVSVRDWISAINLAVYIGGVNPAMRPDQNFSQAHYDSVCQRFGDVKSLNKYKTIFIDSITVASRLCFQWCLGQPEAISEKTGKPDTRGAYGLLCRSMLGWLAHIQHTPGKNVWLVGGLDEVTDDYNRPSWVPQVEGGKLKNEMHGIVDEVYTLAVFQTESGQHYHGLVTQKTNQWGYPAKTRSGTVEDIEEPHLGKLMQKINSMKRVDVIRTTIPVEPVKVDKEGE